jgi:transposase
MGFDGRAHSHEVLEAARYTALELWQQGVEVNVIARSVRVGWRTVYKWLSKAARGGRNALKSSKALGREPRLDSEQFEELKRCLRQPARQYGYSTDLWSGPRLRHLIEERFGVKYHRKHIPRLLKRLGLVLKFPERRALEQDQREVSIWKRFRLPKIIENARKHKGLVFYADEALVSLIPYVGKTWSFPDCKPIVRVSGKRGQHIGMSAAVNRQGRICFELTREGERFTAKTFLRFVRKLRREFPRRHITLIIDGAPIHKAKLVRTFAAANTWLKLEILPAYSPELNPSEKPWRYIKTKKLNASALADKASLRKSTRRVFASLKKDAATVASFFDE